MKPRLLVWVVIWTVALAAGALVLDWFERNKESRELLGRTLLGNVEPGRAGIVLIEADEGQVTLRRTAWGWVVEEQHDFPADMAKLRALLLRLGQARIAQRVPVRPEQLAELGLLQKVENDWRFEAGRTASVLTLIHGIEFKHKMMYQLLVGKRRPGAGTYVRFPSDGKAYLVAEDLALDADAERWIRRAVFDEGAAQATARVSVNPRGRARLDFSRPDAQASWRMDGATELPDAGQVEELVRTLAMLRVVGVGAVASAGASTPASGDVIELHLFDGRAFTLTLAPAPPGAATRTAVFSASVFGPAAREAAGRTPKPGEPRWRVETFNRHFAGRAVQVDAAQATRLLARRSVYLSAR